MFVPGPNNRIEHNVVDKIMTYYKQIVGLSDIIDNIDLSQAKLYEAYIKCKKLLKNTHFVEDKNKIIIRLDNNQKIKIHIDLIDKKLDYSFLKNLQENIIEQTLKINKKLRLEFTFKHMKEEYDVEDLNPEDWGEYYKEISKKDPVLLSYKKIKSNNEEYWNTSNWFKSLDIDEFYYSTIDELIKAIYKYNIETIEDYKKIADNDDKIPLDIMEFYGISFKILMKKIALYIKSKYTNKSQKNKLT
jgi:hypothetical protein